MRFVTFWVDEEVRFGTVVGESLEKIVDVSSVEPRFNHLDAVLADGALEHIRDLVENTSGETFDVSDVTLRPPISRPSKMLFVRANYRHHAAVGTDPEYPSFFGRRRSS